MGKIENKPTYQCDLCNGKDDGVNTYDTDRGFCNWTVFKKGAGYSLSIILQEQVNLPIYRDAKGYFCEECRDVLDKAWDAAKNAMVETFLKKTKSRRGING